MINTNHLETFLRVAILCAGWLLVGASVPPNVSSGGESTWAYPGATGRMIYDSTAIGDRLPNFSSVGYQYGNEPIPQVPQAVFVQPGAGDDTALIQSAINSVSAMPLGQDGFRGAVVLGAGEFQVGGTLNINASGVVLRGSGNSGSGTVLRATGTDQRTLINVRGFSSLNKDAASERPVLDRYVPVGATSFRVDDPSGFAVGDQVIVYRPSTAEWISDLGMDMIPPRPDGMPIVQWAPGSKDLLSDRIVTRVEGDRVFINAPITNSLDAQYGGGSIYKYTYAARLQNVGIENIKSVSDYNGDPTDEDHAWTFIEIDRAEHGWVRDVSAQHYGYSTASIGRRAKNISVVDSQFIDPVSVITGSRRYSFEIEGQLNIVRDSTADNGRHDFVLNSPSPGPNVFFNNSATNSHSDTGPHQRWSTGALFDNISVQGDNINLRNRGYFGTGHGWAGANMVVWNSAADGFIVQNPPTAQNWLIGSVGQIQEDTRFGPQEPGIVDHHGANVDTNSLYLQQLADRMAVSNSQLREYVTGDYDLFVNDGPGSVDVPPVSNNLLNEFGGIIAGAGHPLVGFDDTTNPSLIPFTWNYQVDADEQVYHAVMSLALRKTGGQTVDDALWFELANNELSFAGDLGLTQELSTTESRVIALEFFGTDLSLFQDGEFNILLGDDTGIDWARLELTVGDRLIGDFDFDGVLGVNDINLLCDALDGTDLAFDLNGDGVVDTGDMDQLVLDEIGTLYGDANLDFFVDGQDFVIWNGNKFQSGHGWGEGDFNCDSFVDGQDFVIWNSNKFQSAAPSAVPESSGAAIAVVLACLAVWCLRG